MIIKADSAEIKPESKYGVKVDFYKVEEIDFYDEAEAARVIGLICPELILDQIGKERVMEYFNLKERETI